MRFPALARFAFLMALRRTAADWRLQAAAGFGMVLAVALMASGVIYSNALRETALRHTLRAATAEEVNLAVGVSHVLERPAFAITNTFMQDRLRGPLNRHMEDSALLMRSDSLFFTGLPQLELAQGVRPRGPVLSVTDFDKHVRVVAGRLPQPNPGVLEVVIDSLGASLLDLPVGREIGAFPAVFGEPRQEGTLPLLVVGIIEPLDPEEQYWQLGFPKRFTDDSGPWVMLPLYSDGDAFFDTLGTAFRGISADYFWLFFLDREGLRASGAAELERIITETRSVLHSSYAAPSWVTGLEEVLDRYAVLWLLARIPLFLLVFLAIGVLLYYLFLIAGLMGRLRAAEVAVLRSRGASLLQVGVVILMEGLLMAVPAIIVGPLVAQLLVIATGTLFPVVSGGTGLAFIVLTPSVFILGSIGAILAVIVLVLTTMSAARHGVVELRHIRARPPQMPFFHRYYLDLGFLLLIALLWFQLRTRGSFLVSSLAEDSLEIDLTLLLSPVLGVLAAGLLLFRIFPMVVRAVAWPADSVVPIWLAQGLRRVARDPVPASSLLVLLALATSLGVMASTFTATLERNQRERALYAAGADLRIRYTLPEEMAHQPGLASQLTSLPGVAAAADVLPLGSGLVAVDPVALPGAAWFRSDFSDVPLDQLMGVLQPTGVAPSGIPLPEDTLSLGVWVERGVLSDQMILFARLEDSRGVYFLSELGQVADRAWSYVEAPVSAIQLGRGSRGPGRGRGSTLTSTGYTPVPPLTFHAIWIAAFGRRGDTTGALFFSGLQAITPSGPVEVASFQDLDGWHPLEDPEAPGLNALELSESVARLPGQGSAALTWGGGGASRGLRAGPAHTPLPVVVSPSFLDDNALEVGDEMPLSIGSMFVPVKVVDVMDFFPTVDPRERPFLLTNLDLLLEYVALRVPSSTTTREVWLRSADGPIDSGPVVRAIEEQGGTVFTVNDAYEMVASRTADPLLTTGWSGLLALSFVAVVLASSSALILYTYIDTRERSEEFALLRTVGFSRPQVNRVLWFNLVLVVVIGTAVGTWGGQALGTALLPLLEVAEGGARVTPPMVLVTNWFALGGAYLVLAIAAFITVAALGWAIAHLDIQRILRAGGA